MTLEQIRYFIAAAEFQHVGRAANSVHISPSAVSAAIGALETELNSKLFERRSKRVFLTPAGHQFKSWGVRILTDISSVKSQIGGGQEELQGRFRLGASHFLATELLSPAWFTLQNEYPKLIGDLRSLDTGILMGEVLAGRLDLGVVFSVTSHPEIEQIKVHEGNLVIVVHKSHPLAGKRQNIKNLSDYPAVTHKAAQGSEVCEEHPVFSKLGIVPRTVLYFDSDEIALAKIRNSYAWALLPDFIARGRAHELKVLYEDKRGGALYSISVVKHRHKVVDAVTLKFIEQVKAQLDF